MERKVCQNCGRLVEIDSIYCNQCGTKLSNCRIISVNDNESRKYYDVVNNVFSSVRIDEDKAKALNTIVESKKEEIKHNKLFVLCSDCNVYLDDDMLYCPICGKKISATAPKVTYQEINPKAHNAAIEINNIEPIKNSKPTIKSVNVKNSKNKIANNVKAEAYDNQKQNNDTYGNALKYVMEVIVDKQQKYLLTPNDKGYFVIGRQYQESITDLCVEDQHCYLYFEKDKLYLKTFKEDLNKNGVPYIMLGKFRKFNGKKDAPLQITNGRTFHINKTTFKVKFHLKEAE